MENLDVHIISIESKVEKLIDVNKNLHSESESLRQENNDLKSQVTAQTAMISELENKIKMLKIAKSLEASEVGSTDVKRKITEFVKEIDRCIALLNG